MIARRCQELDLHVAPFSAGDTGNADSLAWLAARGVDGSRFDRAGLVLHNKGLVADGTVVVGSLNGNLHSRAQNREVELVIFPSTYVYSGAVVVAAGVVSALIVRNRIDNLDLVAVLKTRE